MDTYNCLKLFHLIGVIQINENKILLIFLVFFQQSHAENLLITAKNITLDKDQNVSIFKNDVVVKTKGKTLKGDFAKYDRTGFFNFKK